MRADVLREVLDDAAGPVDALSFGCTKNGGMGGDAVVLFDPTAAALVRRRRKRAGHLQSKGRFLAAQILALLDGDLWLANARAANAAAQAVARGAGERLLHPVEANELFVRLDADERAALRGQGFAFYDWDEAACRLVASWDTRLEDAQRLGEAIACL